MANRESQIANRCLAVLLFAICNLLSACALPGNAAPVVKIGVIAPFEGAGRPLGYAVLPAIKAAAAEANARGELGRTRVLVVAFNDDLHGPTAAAQARALALDPEVLAVIGPWTAETVAAAAPILAEAGLPFIAREDLALPAAGERWGDAVLAEAAARASADTRRLLRALADAARRHGRPARAGVAAALP
jgi:ABC-type branched-subunit amino acid transport system substrate-binding protein